MRVVTAHGQILDVTIYQAVSIQEEKTSLFHREALFWCVSCVNSWGVISSARRCLGLHVQKFRALTWVPVRTPWMECRSSSFRWKEGSHVPGTLLYLVAKDMGLSLSPA